MVRVQRLLGGFVTRFGVRIGVAIVATIGLIVFIVAGSSGTATLTPVHDLGAFPTATTELASPTPTPAPTATPKPKPTKPSPKATHTTTSKPPTSTPTTKPGVGVWNLAPGGTGVVGTGSKGLIRYRVEVERATGLSASSVAAFVDQTLADARGWTNEGWRFQRVTLPISQVDMVVRVATPATVDKVCRLYGLNTGGVVSCRGGDYVMINLTRWNTGVSAYGGDVTGYRHLVLNHEIGHRLGHGHVGCPGPGQPEPVMMQVYYTGLQGCAKNVWPYAVDGTRIG